MHLKQTAMIAFVSLAVFAPPGYCLNFDDLLRTYLGTSTGASTDISPSEQGIIKTNINTRQAQLESQMNAGVTSGQLTPSEEQDLRAMLNRIGAQEGTYLADGNYSRWEVQNMLEELNNFSLRLNTYLTNATTTVSLPGGGSWGSSNSWSRRYRNNGNYGEGGYMNNLRQFQADVDAKQALIDSSITDATNAGRLSWSQSAQLRTELQTIANNETTFTADGRLSRSESEQLVSQLDALSAKVTSMSEWRGGRRRDRYGRYNTSVDTRQSLLRQRINAGMSSGRLTRSEATRLLADESRIASMEARLRASGNRLSFDEQRRILNELDVLNIRVSKELNDRQVR